MKFDEALVVIDGVEELINREDISRREDFSVVIDNIFCPEEGCGARLVYNRRSTGLVYLSKHRAYEHDDNCPRLEDGEARVKSITEYVEVNGGLTSKGIQRRIKDSVQALFDHFNPPVKEESKPQKKKNNTKKKTDDETSTKTGIKVNYDPNSEVVTTTEGDSEASVKEPPFYQRLPHEISVKDNGKNLRTSALIENIKIGTNSSNPNAEIVTSFGEISLTFVMPPVFFQGNQRRQNADQLKSFLETIRDYIEKKPGQFYLTSLCQSQDIDLDDIVLYVLEPDFMSFQTRSGIVYSSLAKMVAAISTGAI